MNIQFYFRGLRVNAGLRQRLQPSLEWLERLLPVAAAVARVEYERDQAPAFRASALLAVPGPDLHAEARDHTLDAAWLKVTASLREQIKRRKSRQEARLKDNGKLRGAAPRRVRAPA